MAKTISMDAYLELKKMFDIDGFLHKGCDGRSYSSTEEIVDDEENPVAVHFTCTKCFKSVEIDIV